MIQLIFKNGKKDEVLNIEAKKEDLNIFLKQLEASSFNYVKTKSDIKVNAEVHKLSYCKKSTGGLKDRCNKLLLNLNNLDNGKKRFIDIDCSYFDYRPIQ